MKRHSGNSENIKIIVKCSQKGKKMLENVNELNIVKSNK